MESQTVLLHHSRTVTLRTQHTTAAAPPIWKRGVKALFSRTPDPTTRLFTRQDWTTQEKLRESWIGSDWFQPNHFVVSPPAILEGSEHVNKGH